jgi:hypothetical protein
MLNALACIDLAGKPGPATTRVTSPLRPLPARVPDLLHPGGKIAQLNVEAPSDAN